MNIERLNCLDTRFLESDAVNKVLRFEERRKCLNSIFWYITNKLEQGQKILLVVEKDEELEYLNYFLSRYKIQSLALILNQESDFVSWHTVQKLGENRNQEVDINAYNQAKKSLELYESTFIRTHKQYRQAGLGRLNLLEVRQILEKNKVPTLRLELFKSIPITAYKAKKALVNQASGLYKPEYRFNDQHKLFRKGVFDEQIPESLLVILNHFKERLNKLKSEYQNIENRVYDNLESELNKKCKSLRYQLEQLVALKDSESDSTRSKKFNFQLGKIESVLGIQVSGDSQEEKLKMIGAALSDWESVERSKVSSIFATKLSRINASNSELELKEMFEETDTLIEDVNESNILERCPEVFCNDFQNYKTKLLELGKFISKAVYFLSEESEQLEWCVFYEKCSLQDRNLLDHLLDIEYDWVNCFEISYIKSFLLSNLSQLPSLEKMHDQAISLIQDYEELFHNGLLSKFNSDIPKNREEDSLNIKQGLLWSLFARDHADDIFERFPLVMVKPDFYNEQGSKFTTACDVVIAVNHVANTVDTSGRLEQVFAFYNSENEMQKLPVKSLEDLDVINMRGMEFNINRSAHFLKGTELNKLSNYLADGIKHFNPNYRIFQLKDKAVLSLLSNEKNAELFFRLEDKGIKEILSHDENINLIPAVLNESISSTLILVEDLMLNALDSTTILQQKLFLEKMRISGLNLLSFDNYNYLNSYGDEMGQMVKRILEKPEPAMAMV